MRAIALSLLLVCAAHPFVHAQGRPGFIVVTSATDTIAVERISNTPTTLTGDLRLPQQQAQMRYVAHLRADGSIAEVQVFEDGPGFFSGTITFDERAAVEARMRGAPRRRYVMAPASTYPIIGTSVGLMELLARASHATTRDSTTAHVFNIRNRLLGTATIARIAGDSLAITCDGCQRIDSHQVIHLGVSPTGDFTGGVALEPRWVITRQ